jgi:exocyst complex component 5
MLLPLAGTNVTIQRTMSKTTASAITSLEEKTSLILHRTLDAALAWTSKLLSNQRKTDFRPRDDSSAVDLLALQTPTCLSLLNFLSKFYTRVSAALDGPNLSSFVTELAIHVRTLLLEHFKRFNVSPAGGLLVTKDVTKYVELMRSWPLEPGLAAGLSVLTEVANLFVVGPEALRERLRGGVMTAAAGVELQSHDLRAYVLKREDSSSVGVQAVLNSM